MSLLQDFAELADELLRDFTGRAWLVQCVREFLDDPHAPHFFLIVGEPGIGKSAFIAYLWQRVQISDAVHLCIGGRGGTTEPLSFVQSLAVQLTHRVPGFGQALVEAQEAFPDRNVIITVSQPIKSMEGGQVTGVSIQHLEVRGLPPETAFDRLIRLPLRALDEGGELPQVVILVDALDEAVAHVSRPYIVEILRQAHDLPLQVRFVLTSRPDPSVLGSFADLPHVTIEAQSPENQEDVAHYLTHILQCNKQLVGILIDAGWDEARFVNDLGEMGEWNFLYLSLVLPEIAAGRLHLGQHVLPSELDGYYRYLLSTRLGLEKWGEWGADLMEVVLALQEPASLKQIAAYLRWSKRQAHWRLEQVGQLLDPGLREQERYWRYHWSVADFLTDQDQAREFWCDEQQGHARIADHYLRAWRGLETGLPGLQEPEKRDLHGGYGPRHLVAHLEGADRVDDLHCLLCLEWQVGKQWENLWYAVKEGTGDTSDYLADVAHAWRLVEEAYVPTDSAHAGQSISLQIRYSLIIASFNSLANNFPPALLTILVEKGVWSPAQGLAYARQMPEPEQRALTLARLASHLAALGCSEKALAVARELPQKDRWGGSPQVMTLAGLAPHLPEVKRSQLLGEALVVARELPEEMAPAAHIIEQAGVWCAACPGLTIGSGDLTMLETKEVALGQAGVLAQHLNRQYRRGLLTEDELDARVMAVWTETSEAVTELVAQALAELASWVPGPSHFEEILVAARETEDGCWQARVLAGIAPRLPEPLLREALAVARAIEDKDARAVALAGLVCRLAELGHPDEALAVMRVIESEYWRVKALARLGLHISQLEQPLQNALTIARAIEDEYWRARALAGLAPHLPESLLREALAAARAVEDRYWRERALAELALRMAELSHHEEALAIAQAIENEWWRARALAGLALQLSRPLLQQALEAALVIGWGRARAEALAVMASRLAELGHPEEALATAREIENGYWRARALAGLVPHLPQSKQVLREALGQAQEVGDAYDRAQALVELALHLPEPDQALQEALAAARAIGDEQRRVSVLLELASHLSNPEQALQEALAAARGIQSEHSRARVLEELGSYLPEDLLWEALVVARMVEDERLRAQVVESLAVRLADLGHSDEALAVAREIENEYWRAGALARLVPHLPESLLREALVETLALRTELQERVFDEGDKRGRALGEMASRLAELGHPEEALAIAREIEDEYLRARTLGELTPHLTELLLEEALAMAWAIEDKWWGAEALAGLGDPNGALARAREVENRFNRVNALMALVPHLPLPEQALQEALTEVQKMEEEGWRAEALALLARLLPEDLLQEALVVARAVEDEWLRAPAVESLAVRLADLGHPDEALAVAREIENDHWPWAELAPHLSQTSLQEALGTVREIENEYWRGQALGKLVSHLPKPLFREALAAACEIGRRPRAEILARLTPRLTKLSPATLYPLWYEALHILARRTREDLLSDLRALSPVIAELGGEEAIAETFHAIQDVGRWWP